MSPLYLIASLNTQCALVLSKLPLTLSFPVTYLSHIYNWLITVTHPVSMNYFQVELKLYFFLTFQF